MGEKRSLDAATDRMTFGRRIRILRHRTARWFQPPVRQTPLEPTDPLPRLRVLTTASSRRLSSSN